MLPYCTTQISKIRESFNSSRHFIKNFLDFYIVRILLCNYVIDVAIRYSPPLHGREHACQGPQVDHCPFWGGGVTLAGTGQGGRSMHTISSWSWPTQTRPPNAGAGFVQVRRRVFIAKPQVWEQADHADQAVQPPWMVQFVTLTRAPVQLSPPCCGGGLLHSLVWHWHVSIFCKTDFKRHFHR